MKKIILPLLALGASAVSASAQTVIERTVGQNTLLAGFDFQGNIGTSVAQAFGRYSDLYSVGSVSIGSAAYGTVHFTSQGGTFASNVSRPGSGDVDRQIATRSGGTDQLGELAGSEGSVTLNQDSGSADFAIKVTTLTAFNIFQDVNVDFYARSNGAGSITVDWFYATSNGGTKIATGLSTVVTGGSYSNYTVNFSAIDATEGVTDLYLIGRVTESAATAALNLDNLAIYGTAAAIPEPSTFAALAGLAGLGFAASRRRRVAA